MVMDPDLGNLENIPLETRLPRCHELAEETFARAAEAKSDVERDQLVSLGLGWRSLAMETEQALRKLRGLKSL